MQRFKNVTSVDKNVNISDNKRVDSKISQINYRFKFLFVVTVINAIVFYLIYANSTTELLVNILRKLPGYNLDQDHGRNAFEIIESRGFKYESHMVITKDGFHIQMVRIVNPFNKNQTQHRPILLFHGLVSSCGVFVINRFGHLDEYGNYIEYDEHGHANNNTEQAGNTLGFVLSARGYDVWLANYRANSYSSYHSLYTPEDDEYWKYSLDDIVQYDLTAMIDYILSHTKHSSLSFVGHSQGNTLMLALMSITDSYKDRVRPFIALAPSWTHVKLRAPISYISVLKPLFKKLRPQPFLLTPRGLEISREIMSNIASNKYLVWVVRWFVDLMIGFDPNVLRLDRVPVYFSMLPEVASSWNAIQQIDRTLGIVKQFDYGQEENMKIYGRKDAPEYDLSKINSSHIALYYSEFDSYDSLEDVNGIKEKLRYDLVDELLIREPGWDHLSFIWAKKLGELVNHKIIKLLSRYD